MLQVLPETGDGIIAVKFEGWIESDEFRDFMPRFEDAIVRAGAARALLDWRGLAGWEPEVESDQFVAQIAHSRTFERVAIVGPSKWIAAAARLREILRGEVRFYEPDEREDAWRWLRDG